MLHGLGERWEGASWVGGGERAAVDQGGIRNSKEGPIYGEGEEAHLEIESRRKQ